MGDCSQVCHPCIQPIRPGQLSLAIPPWVVKMSTGHGYGRNGEFWVTGGPVNGTASILTQSVKGAGC